MSERKVLNKYYPPDFDPSKIPRVKRDHNKTFTVRLMAPFNMRCTTCGEYIYKGRKFNARKEDVENEDFLGLRIYRFYIKCTRCLSEISFKTDPQSTDYVLETGATRNFMALKLAEEQAAKEEEARKEEEASNPMKMLENRTKQSREEIESIEALEELREMSKRQQGLNYDSMLESFEISRQKERERQLLKAKEEDEEEIKKYFGLSQDGAKVKRIIDDEEDSKMKIRKSSQKHPVVPLKLAVKKQTLLGVVKAADVSNFVDEEITTSALRESAQNISNTSDSSSFLKEALDNSYKNDSVLSSVANSLAYSEKNANLQPQKTKIKATGLSLLGAYSDSEEESN
nr:EOG090X0G3U [Artemia franciscana]